VTRGCNGTAFGLGMLWRFARPSASGANILVEHALRVKAEVWPLETRMLNSIEGTIAASGVTIEELSTSRPKEWGDKNLYQRADALGWSEMYLGTFGGPSASVHGNWMDLLGMHLDDHDGGEGFTPSPK
jgi:hypothetical protein